MDSNLVEENELIEKRHITIIDVINDIYNTNNFIWLLECLSENHGLGSDQFTITFWNDLDDYDKSFYEKPFTGVELRYLSDEDHFTLEEFYFYIELAVKNFLKKDIEENNKNYINDLLLKTNGFKSSHIKKL